MMKAITLKISEKELAELDEKAKRSNMTRSDYIKQCLKQNPITVIDKSTEFYPGHMFGGV